MMSEQPVLDLRGLKCPMPVLRTKKALAGLPPGQVLTVLTDDAHAPADIAQFAQQSGHTLLGQSRATDSCDMVHRIRRHS